METAGNMKRSHQHFIAKTAWFILYQDVLVQLPNSGGKNIGDTSEESQSKWARVPQISKFQKDFMITVMFTSGLISMIFRTGIHGQKPIERDEGRKNEKSRIGPGTGNFEKSSTNSDNFRKSRT